MNIEGLREYCLTVQGATETLYFEGEYLIFRVFDKWFAVIPLNGLELNISLKCDPAKAIELRERYKSVTAAWHFNKKYWNNIILNDDMDDETLKYWIRHSVAEVVKKLPRKIQMEYWEKKQHLQKALNN
jgi:predicted DNA-binding protein (MmcQ/YjbR family)